MNLIKVINQKVLLKDLFSKFNFQTKYSENGWTHFCCCPFPDHKDDSPSFYFNPKQNCFNCFGCSRGGKAVDFISYKDNISKHEAAVKLSSQVSDLVTDFSINLEIEKENKVLDAAAYFQEWILNHKNDKNAIDYYYNLIDTLELYLKNHHNDQTIDFQQLDRRINFCKEKLAEYE